MISTPHIIGFNSIQTYTTNFFRDVSQQKKKKKKKKFFRDINNTWNIKETINQQ